MRGPAGAAPTAPTVAPGVLRSLLALIVCGGSAALLAAFGASTAGTTHARLDDVVSSAVLAVGAVAASLLTVGCVLLTVTAVGRATGRTLDRLERASTRLTPALLRRAVAVTITTGIGLGAVPGVATASEIDLGWEVTESTSVPVDRADVVAAGSATLRGGAAPPAHAEATPAEVEPAVQSAGSGSAEPEAAEVDAGVPESTEPGPDGPGSASGVDPTGTRSRASTEVSVGGDPTSSTTATTTPSAATDRTTPTAATTDLALGGPAAVAETVTVRAGDTLWDIAAAHLPAGRDDADVAAAWPDWYAANRVVVGPDPDLIHPGQVLTAPVVAP